MSQPLPVAIIGLDTSHSVEYPRRMQAPDCPAELRVPGLRAVSCLRFPSAFQPEAGQDARQAQLVAWGVRVASDLADAVRGAEAIMLEINDPTLHLHWFEQVAQLGLPVFIDKPLADTVAAGAALLRLARKHGTRMATCSSLRSDAALQLACAQVPKPDQAWIYGPLGKAPAGSSVVWYGVHTFEMIQRAMGLGAVAVTARRDACGVVAVVDYGDRRRAVAELTSDVWNYGGTLRVAKGATPFAVDSTMNYTAHLREVESFLRGGAPPATLDEALEVMAMLDAADRSAVSGRTEPVYR
jgi:predicted dehydrogenase